MTLNRERSSKLKQFFKGIGLDPRFRTVAVKHPFLQVWLKYDGDQSFPNHIRIAAVLCEYSRDTLPEGIRDPENIHYGNTSAKSLSISGDNVDRFIALCNDLNPNK